MYIVPYYRVEITLSYFKSSFLPHINRNNVHDSLIPTEGHRDGGAVKKIRNKRGSEGDEK